ncbi:MAG: response regulator [Actinomycetota bacterium]
MALLKRKEDEWDGKVDRRRPPRVLVVNDDAEACELLVRFLGLAGFQAGGADSDTTAMYLMSQHLPRCVVLDLQTGGVGSSLKLLDQIRTHPDRRINSARVVLCAPSPKNRTFSFQSGADAFVVRPFHVKDLVAEVTDVIKRPQDERARHRRDELARGA